MSQNLHLSGFKWAENTSQFSKIFTKNYYEVFGKEYFLKVDIKYYEKLHVLHNLLLVLSQ